VPDLHDHETRLAILERIAADMRATLESLDRRMLALEAAQRADFRWLVTIMLGGYASLLGVMAHGFHWI
jgi:hypothetical protein